MTLPCTFLSPASPLPQGRRRIGRPCHAVTARAPPSNSAAAPPAPKILRSTLHLDWIIRGGRSNAHLDWIKPAVPDPYYAAKAAEEEQNRRMGLKLSPASVKWARDVTAMHRKVLEGRQNLKSSTPDRSGLTDISYCERIGRLNEHARAQSLAPSLTREISMQAANQNLSRDEPALQSFEDLTTSSISSPDQVGASVSRVRDEVVPASHPTFQELLAYTDSNSRETEPAVNRASADIHASDLSVGTPEGEKESEEQLAGAFKHVVEPSMEHASTSESSNYSQEENADPLHRKISDDELTESLAERTRVLTERALPEGKSLVEVGGGTTHNGRPMMLATSAGNVSASNAADQSASNLPDGTGNLIVSAILVSFVAVCLLLAENFHGMIAPMSNFM